MYVYALTIKCVDYMGLVLAERRNDTHAHSGYKTINGIQ